MAERPPAFVDVTPGEGGGTAMVDPAWAAAVSEGHFPGAPLLPGSALLDLMVLAVRALGSDRLALAGIEHAVFRRRVHPVDRIVVSIRERATPYATVIVRANDADAAEARLRFEPVA